ncbi:unnamed protein product [Absidia cylindrospora]
MLIADVPLIFRCFISSFVRQPILPTKPNIIFNNKFTNSSRKQHSIDSAEVALQKGHSSTAPFKRPHTPVTTRTDRKGTKRLRETSFGSSGDNNSTTSRNTARSISSAQPLASSTNKKIYYDRNNADNGNPTEAIYRQGRGSVRGSEDYMSNSNVLTARPGNTSRVSVTPSEVGTIQSARSASLARSAQPETSIQSIPIKKPRQSKKSTQPYRQISSRAREEVRKLLHSAYESLIVPSSSTKRTITDKEHASITSLIKKIDNKVKTTMVSTTIPEACCTKKSIEDELEQITAKIDGIVRQKIAIEIDNFYTQIDSAILKLQIEELAKQTQNDSGDTGDDDTLAMLPHCMTKYVVRPVDFDTSYEDDLQTHPSSFFSL